MRKKDRPLLVVIEHYSEGPASTLIATQMRQMTFIEWVKYRLSQLLSKSIKLTKPPTGFPNVSVGVWIHASQYKNLIGKDNDTWALPSNDIPRKMVLMAPAELTAPECNEDYEV